MSLGGIYKLTSSDGRFYIGSTLNFKARWHSHKQDLKKGRHPSSLMQKFYNEHGIDSFKFEILLVCGEASLGLYETSLIRELKPEYNGSAGAFREVLKGKKASKEECSERYIRELNFFFRTGSLSEEERERRRLAQSIRCLNGGISAKTRERMRESARARAAKKRSETKWVFYGKVFASV